MNQPRKLTLAEVGIHSAIGMAINWPLNVLLVGWLHTGLGWPLAWVTGVITIIIVCITMVRQFILRRWFNTGTKTQTRKGSLAEVVINTVVGVGLNWPANALGIWLALHVLGLSLPVAAIIATGAVLTTSVCRQFTLRRAFNWHDRRRGRLAETRP